MIGGGIEQSVVNLLTYDINISSGGKRADRDFYFGGAPLLPSTTQYEVLLVVLMI